MPSSWGSTGRCRRTTVRSPRDTRAGSPRRYCAEEAGGTREHVASRDHRVHGERRVEGGVHVIGEGSPAALCRAGERSHHDIVATWAGLDELAAQCAIAAADEIACDSVAHRPRDDDAQPQWFIGVALEAVVDRRGRDRATAATDDHPEVVGADDP